MQQGRWPRVAVLGAGAVGCYFGGMLARAGVGVTLIGRPHHVEAIRRDGLTLESVHFRERIPVAATTETAGVCDADVVLLCVKTLDTEEAARAVAAHLGSDAVLVSMQNGVDNVERIRAATNLEAVAAAVYVAAQITAPGCVRHTGRGDLILGNRTGPDAPPPRRLEELATCFADAGIPCRVFENIEGELWLKLIMNCAYNAMSALCRARYRQITSDAWTREIMRQVIEEVVAVARAADVHLPGGNLVEAGWKLAETMPEAMSSTAQDISRGKRTEIDALNGYIARRGPELGIPTPVNQTLHALVKLLEETT